jgi:glycosyltransferase involved in cell wall biosynthesis
MDCLAALERQNYPSGNFEVIVVDNGSIHPVTPYESSTLLTRLVRCNEPGSYAARNRGAHMAGGAVLAFTDADCVPAADWVSAGTAALLAGEELNIIGGEVIVTRPAVRNGTALYQHAIGFQQENNILRKRFTATANMFCTMEQFLKVGEFDETLLSGGDREWCWRAGERGYVIAYEPKAVVHTEPRTRLRDAVRQARRVAGGRAYLGARGPSTRSGLQRYRTIGQSIAWICSLPHHSVWERIRILTAATAIRISAGFESIRLRSGRAAERQ